ncbi:MAG TPA: serine/threonine-protein kinase [Polyangiaceae bacterium]|nr:serine/threonine-protein kinase [Polyangiaceae bacterium]
MASEAAPTAQHERQPGDVIAGRYVLERKLGEGGMGVVWVAQSTALDVQVALKMLRRELAGAQAVDRMAREARTAAQLGHPALVRVLDFGTSERSEPYLAMELLEGEELHSRLAREKRISGSAAVALLLPIIDGLGTAHEKGIVHRDIKPENIFIAKDQQGRVQPKVLDFGIAKLSHDHAPSRLTQVGDVMGSPYYLSPEQAEGLDDIDFRTDIWAIGVVLYEAVCGVVPFEAPNYNALIRSILRNTPKPMSAHDAGDAQLWTIVERCLRKDREQRWGSMWELGEALALWLFERGVRVDASARSLRHGWLDGGVTGLQILVPSDPPSAPPQPMHSVEASSPQSGDDPGALSRTHLRPKKSRLAPALAAIGMLGVALPLFLTRSLWLFGPAHQAAPPAPAAHRSSSRPAEEPARAAVTAAVAVPETPSADAPSVPSAEMRSVAPSSRSAAKAPVKRAASHKPPARWSNAGAPAAAPTGRVNTEFGF